MESNLKDQFFADRRDFFKWDLLEDLTTPTSGRSALCYIAMLTAPDTSREGELRGYPCGARRSELHEFLQSCVAAGRHEVRAIREYFGRRGLEYRPFGDSSDRYYTYDNRESYFRAIPDAFLQGAVVFLDPDIGLSAGSESYMRRVGIDKYLLDDDLRGLSSRLGATSIVVVYQHLQRDRSRVWDDIEDRCQRVCLALGTAGSSFVTDRDVAFLVTSRDSTARLAAARVIVEHAHKHGLDSGELVARR